MRQKRKWKWRLSKHSLGALPKAHAVRAHSLCSPRGQGCKTNGLIANPLSIHATGQTLLTVYNEELPKTASGIDHRFTSLVQTSPLSSQPSTCHLHLSVSEAASNTYPPASARNWQGTEGCWAVLRIQVMVSFMHLQWGLLCARRDASFYVHPSLTLLVLLIHFHLLNMSFPHPFPHVQILPILTLNPNFSVKYSLIPPARK